MTQRSNVRPAAVAGLFYPQDPRELRALLGRLLAANPATGPAPKALIAPHAGYIYSGALAARAYNCVAALADTVRRVVLLGPAHRVALRGLALSSAIAFHTPLGEVPLDQQASAALRTLPQVSLSDTAHSQEHSLEVHLPFLQTLLRNFTLIPLVVGGVQPGEVAEVLEQLWGGAETLIVVSSDLSHYHTYDIARKLDSDTAQRIESLLLPLEAEQACGADPINGLLSVARRRQLAVTRLDLRNSGDTAGTRERVVGYGAWSLHAA